MQTDMGGYQPWQAGTSGSLKAYEPTWRDKLARVLMGEERASPERARLVEGLTGSRGMGNTGIGVIDAVPGVGQALQAQEAVRSGDTDMLAMALMPGSKQVKSATGAADDAARAGIRAYHGSPHDFDRFDMSKIGTGEGAQAYGHGLYFAESEGVANSYRQQLGDYSTSVKWKGDAPPTPLQQLFINKLSGPDARGEMMTVPKLRRELARMEYDAREGMFPDAKRAAEYRAQIQELSKVENLIETTVPGRLYEVRINADPDDFLDWDKPLSQQSEKVRGALESGARKWLIEDGTGSGGWTYAAKTPGVAQKLNEAGIKGTAYLDQGSRTAGEGSRNYVVFRDDIIDIVRKYGIAAAASMYGMDQVQRVLIADQLQPAAQ